MAQPGAASLPPDSGPPESGTAAERSLGRSRWVHILVSGPSMVPTLRHGDHILVRRTRRIRAGDVVVGAFPARPELLVVKRAVRRAGSGWWLASDNEAVADDSRRYGPAEVYGRAVARCWPLRRVGILSRRDLAGTE
ncbi:S26 family signal peptidase [Cryptosporangium aurantiacum]|uniref:Nickel-type superoxide dismutase maturation protease n=1 Tax=Cryptosporangium aurantiacum TaxID=134849 RepID=A0A1M7QM43_9ACTN|nr:S26 family signal peptidase [Cryptosporangium aurantiacum]SHN32438.1 nickel-type superoxide dismutase maturation protease [Cryptosporangium aurantiacum]